MRLINPRLCHFFWLETILSHIGSRETRAGVVTPLLQCIRVPPRAHDIHQIVEHVIEVVKCFVRKWLSTTLLSSLYVASLSTATPAMIANIVRLDKGLDIFHTFAVITCTELRVSNVILLYSDGQVALR
jgi:hypothetical protein